MNLFLFAIHVNNQGLIILPHGLCNLMPFDLSPHFLTAAWWSFCQLTIVALSRLPIFQIFFKLKNFVFIVNADEVVHSCECRWYVSLNGHTVFGWVIKNSELLF